MSDRAPIQLHVPDGLPDEVRAAVLTAVENSNMFDTYADDEPQTKFVGDDAILGSEDEVQEMMQQVITDTGVDFAYRIWQDPKYEFNGALIWHTPGLEDFTSDATADGDVIVNAPGLVRLVDSATDLDSLRVSVRAVTGADHEGRLVYPQPS